MVFPNQIFSKIKIQRNSDLVIRCIPSLLWLFSNNVELKWQIFGWAMDQWSPSTSYNPSRGFPDKYGNSTTAIWSAIIKLVDQESFSLKAQLETITLMALGCSKTVCFWSFWFNQATFVAISKTLKSSP